MKITKALLKQIIQEEVQKVISEQETILSKALATVSKEGLNINSRVEFGVASDTIVKVSERGNYDLIVLGRKGLGTVKRFMLGSVSDDVSHKAKRSILLHKTKIN